MIARRQTDASARFATLEGIRIELHREHDLSTMNPVPSVSVFIPAYNVVEYIDDAVDSVLAQTRTDFELLIIDDCSTDGTYERLKRRADIDSRVRVERNERNLGRPATRNRGLSRARGRFTALMDADDRCAPERLAKQIEYLEAAPEIDVLGTLWWVTDRDGAVRTPDDQRRQNYTTDEIAVRLLFSCPVHQPTIMARTSVLANYRYDDSFPVAQDHELWARMAQQHRFAVLPERLLYYRQHEAQATAALTAISEARQRIAAGQLESLGLSFEARDLFRHDHLFHFKGRRLFEQQSGLALDMAFLRWARRWLTALVEANATRRVYPEPAFERIMAARWLFLCRKTAGGRTPAPMVWREFFKPPFKRALWGAFRAGQLN